MVFGWRRGVDIRERFSGTFGSLLCAKVGDVARSEPACPEYAVVPDPVVGPAWEAPVADRRHQRDGFTIEG